MTVTGLLSIEVLDQPSQSIYIAAVQSLITDNPSLKHQLHGMGTNIEGPLSDIVSLVPAIHDLLMVKQGVKGMEVHLNLSFRSQKEPSLGQRIASVQEKLA